MNVHIGPYTNWIGPYQIADWLQYVGVSKDTCYKIGEWLSGGDAGDSWLMKMCFWIESKRSRSVQVHIDSYDTWNMDSTLAIIILPMLKQLQATKHGAPMSMDGFQQISDSAQFCFDFYAEGDELAYEQGQAQWTSIMDEMVWTFEQLQPDYDWEDQYWIVHPEMDLTDHPEDAGKTSTPLRWKVKGECDWEARRLHGERIERGLELFGRYYINLWD